MAAFDSTYRGRTCLLLLAALVMKFAMADYDSDLCDKYAGSAADTDTVPYFFDDYEAVTEDTVYSKDGSTEGKVVHRVIRYSGSHKQLDIQEISLRSRSYYFVDQNANECTLEDRTASKCQRGKAACPKVRENVDLGFFNLIDGKVSLTDSGQKLFWPVEKTGIKKKVTKGSSSVRGMSTNLLVTCFYDENEEITTVSEWHVLDVDKYQNVDKQKKTVLMSHHHRSKNKTPMQSRRIDYFNYRKLSLDELQYGLELDENACRDISRLSMKKMPSFPLRFSFLQEVDGVENNDFSKLTRYDQKMEYNRMSQIIKATNYHDKNDENEKEISYRYTDYSTKHTFYASETLGSCKIQPGSEEDPNMPSVKGFWGMDNPLDSFVKIYRDIPCNKYYSWDNNSPLIHNYLCLATSEWLKNQGRDENEFYPVMTESHFSGKSSKQKAIFEYAENPGYHYPRLRDCFDKKTIVNVNFNLLVDFDTVVKNQLVRFEYETRTFIKKITGIVSSVRIQNLMFYKDMQNPGETVTHITIYGDAKELNRTSNKAYYDTDPVTSQEALDKIQKAVDAGSVVFSFEQKQTTVKFRKGSFRQHSFTKVMAAESTGHSSGAMAGVGIAMTLVGLALGFGLLFGYKKITQGGAPALSFSFGKDGIKEAA